MSKEQLIEQAIALGMKKVYYEKDGLFYSKTIKLRDLYVCVEFKEDLSFAQVCREFDFEVIKPEETLEMIKSLEILKKIL